MDGWIKQHTWYIRVSIAIHYTVLDTDDSVFGVRERFLKFCSSLVTDRLNGKPYPLTHPASHFFYTLAKTGMFCTWMRKGHKGCNLPVPVRLFFSSLGWGLITSPYLIAGMLTLAFLMKKVHLQLLEDIRLIWPLQTDLTTNPHSFPSRSNEWFMYLNRAIIGSIVSLLTKFNVQWNRIPNKQRFLFFPAPTPTLPCLISSSLL